MAGLQRSSISFRRQGSSGIIWDDKLLSGELSQLVNQKEDSNTTTTTASSASSDGGKAQPQEQASLQEGDQQQRQDKEGLVVKVSTIERSRSNGGGRGFRTGKVSPAIEPPSPKVSACGFCSAFGKQEKKTHRRAKPGKRKM